jgi:hypothetical protein
LGTIRLTVGRHPTEEEVDAVAATLVEAENFLWDTQREEWVKTLKESVTLSHVTHYT